MNYITFDQISNPGRVIAENALYKHYHYPEMLIRYDSNFIDFKIMPTIDQFKEAAAYLRAYHVQRGQKHVKFTFPEQEKLPLELENYLNEEYYDIGFLELYAIDPDQFPLVSEDRNIEVQVVTEENLEDFLKFQYVQDLTFGSTFANQKVGLHMRNFKNPNVLQLLASYQGISAGSVQVNLSEEYVEIDDLVVDEEYQGRGIGSRLQKLVMEFFKGKIVILVADGEDTPREMYQRQNYRYMGYKYNAQKVYE